MGKPISSTYAAPILYIEDTSVVPDKDTCNYYQLFYFDKLLLVSVSCLVFVSVHRSPNKQPNALPKVV